MKWFIACFIALIMGNVALAQVNNSPRTDYDLPPVDVNRFPTYQAWATTIVPRADRLDIATRLWGYEKPTFRANAPLLEYGAVKSFSVVDTSRNAVLDVNAELVGIGRHIYIWVETGAKVNTKAIDALVASFDDVVYPQVRTLWGEEPTPGIDGDPRIYALFTRQINPQVSAYFTSQHTYPRQIMQNSNEHEMITFNLNEFENIMNSSRTLSVMAHEFQHMIRHNVDGNESAWVDEGFSVFTEKYLALDDNFVLVSDFLSNPNTQINNWGNTRASYGASLMFIQYFYERFGLSALQQLSSEASDGLNGVDRVLRQLGHSGSEVFFADWVLANAIQDVNTGYGYQNGWQGLPAVATTANVSQYPYLTTQSVNQYATQYYNFSQFNGSSKLHIHLEKPSEARIVPEESPSGARYWYSNNGDESDTTLTRAFDLSAVSSATLLFRTWYSLETYWDYLYVMVSTDGGVTWELQSGFGTTAENPNDRAYGVGYTGPSTKWVTDKIDLTPYAGKSILVRFEMITDDAKTLIGVALDDIAIPEIGYRNDFELDDGGWIPGGWILSDNRLPQRTWIQAVQYMGGQVSVTRWLAQEAGQFTLDLLPNVERVVLAVSPFAPLTVVPMEYSLFVGVE